MKILARLKSWWAFKKDPHLHELMYATNQHIVNKILESMKEDCIYQAFFEKYKEAVRKAMRDELNSTFEFQNYKMRKVNESA